MKSIISQDGVMKHLGCTWYKFTAKCASERI